MSRNSGRTKASASPAPTQAVDSTTTAAPPATLSFVAPTEFVELPSRGKFYPPAHPLYKQETIEIRYMTAKDEDILTSKALLKSGLAIDRLIANLIVNKDIHVDDLLVGDKNALLLAARISGYGNEYAVRIGCPACGAVNEHMFDLSTIGNSQGIQPEEDSDSGVSQTDHGTFTAVLPRSEYTVEFRLFTSQDEKDTIARQERLEKLNLPDSTSTDLLKTLIVSVNNVTDVDEINNFVDNMPAQDARFLRACVKVVTPNVDLSQEVECSSCGAVTETEVPFTSEFFWPK